MGVITIVGAGMMGSAMSYPASDNGHEVRLVGTPLDREIIDRTKSDGYHITLKRQLPSGIKCYQTEELDEAKGLRFAHRRRKQLRRGLVWKKRAAEDTEITACAFGHKRTACRRRRKV